MPSPKPRTIILVPGAFHDPWYYHHLITRLEARSSRPARKIITISLPSNHVRDSEEPNATPAVPRNLLQEDTDLIESHLASEIFEHHNPVLLVAHSYGSVPASCALEKFAELETSNDGNGEAMVKFLIVCGLMLKRGEALWDYCPEPGKAPPIGKVEGEFAQSDENVITLYNGVPEDEKRRAIDGLLWQHTSACTSPTTFEGWAAVPTTYLVCTEDQAIPPAAQDMFLAISKERGVDVDVVRLDTGHTPMLSLPEEFIRVVEGLLK